jgi:hypothetical protein
MLTLGPLLDAVTEVREPFLRNLDAGPIAPSSIPAEPDAVTEEVEALGQGRDVRLVRRECELHLVVQRRMRPAEGFTGCGRLADTILSRP